MVKIDSFTNIFRYIFRILKKQRDIFILVKKEGELINKE